MSSSLRQRLNDLASSFASNVLDAIRGTSLEDLLAGSSGTAPRAPARPAAAVAVAVANGAPPRPVRRSGGRLPRRSTGDIAQVVESIVGLLKQSPKGLRAEQIREKLGLQAKELPRPLKEALDGGQLGRAGQKRATTYFVRNGSGGTAAGATARRGKGRKGARGPKRAKAVKAKRAAKAGKAKSPRPTPSAGAVAQGT
jgi:hypothetical protein